MKRTLLLCLCVLALLCNAGAAVTSSIYYKPYVGYCGDPMPFFDPISQEFRIYYLYEKRPNPAGTYHPVYAITTTNLCDYTEWGEVLPTGDIYDQDAAIGTGSVVYSEADQTYYFFYTGNRHNPSGIEDGQVVMCATSADGRQWEKGTLFLRPSAYGYYKNDFRDPDVFLAEDGLWHMLVSTGKDGKHVLAEFTSANLLSWEHKGIFMPMMWDRFYECPDVFKMGEWWYLVYSELHKEIRRVQYFKASTFEGLKECTKDDVAQWPDDHEGYLDSRGFYAGKTASDGQNRYIWGWCPTRKNNDNTKTNNDNGEPDWAGNLVAHRLVQHADGTLSLGEVPSIHDRFGESLPVEATSLSLSSGEKREMETLLKMNHLSMTVTTSGNNDDFGITLCQSSFTKKYYTLQVHPEESNYRKVNFLQEGTGGMGYIPYIDSYLFPQPADRTYHLDIYTDGTVLVLYINDHLCYTNRVYSMENCHWGLTCYSGSITVTDIRHWGWSATSALDEISAPRQAVKHLENGQIIILRDGIRYTLMGTQY